MKHMKFGVGVVTAITEGGRDYEVTVNFDKAGIKKMFASFAKLKKCSDCENILKISRRDSKIQSTVV